MKELIRISLLIFSLLLCVKGYAQDLHFSQFYENALLRNPALIGIFGSDYKVGVGYRNQWSSVTTPYKTYLASAETRIGISDEANDCLSLGLTMTNDVAGSVDFNSIQACAAINYNKALGANNQSFLSLGFATGFIQRAMNTSKMTFSTQYFGGTYNPGVPTGESLNNIKLTYLDIGTGISFNSSLGENNKLNYYIGAAAFHVNRPKAAFGSGESFVRMDMKWSGNFGFSYQLSNELGSPLTSIITFKGNTKKLLEEVYCVGKIWMPLNKLFSPFQQVFFIE